MDATTKRFLLQQLMWIGISFAISIAISMVVPFPYSLPVIIGVFIIMSYYIRQRQMRRMGIGGKSSMFSPMFGSSSGGSGVDYYCMSCGVKHNQASCPRCGSRMKRVGF